MINNIKTRSWILLLIAMLIIVGCGETQTNTSGFLNPNANQKITKEDTTRVRFQEPTAQGPSAVESAIELSQKYSNLLEDLDRLRQENQRLATENESLKEQIGPCQQQLTQAQKELTEANDLLIEMRIELNNWKTNILGFRDEMRQADQAQLEALLKILTVLGGEIETNAQNTKTTSPETASEPNQTEPPVVEPNNQENSNG